LIAAQAHRTSLRQLEILVLMGSLQAFAPLSTDMYLPSLPLLERVFGATTAQVQFTLATFFVGYALGQSLYGPITDRYGRKPPLYFSLTLFVLSSLACATTRSIGALAFFRLLQAIGACGGVVISRAMVRDLFPPDQMRRVFSMLMLVLGVSPIAAPLLGGYILLWYGWKAIFFTQASLGVACLLGVHLRLPESLSSDDFHPLHASHILCSYQRLFRDRTFLGASFVSGFSSAGMFAYIASAPFVFINLYGVSTQNFGWLFGAIAAGVITASQVNGRMLHGVPLWRVLRIANLVQLGAGILLLAAALSGKGGLPGVFVPVFIYVSAAGFVFPNGSAIAMMRHGKIAGMASALLGTNQFTLAAIATIVLGTMEITTALPMAIVIAGCGASATLLNFLTLGSKLEKMPV